MPDYYAARKIVTVVWLAAPLDELEDARVGPPVHLEVAAVALLQPPQAVVDQDVAPRHLQRELDHRRAAGRHQRRLDVRLRLARPLRRHPVEDLADDVERADQVRAADAEE